MGPEGPGAKESRHGDVTCGEKDQVVELRRDVE
jgi:hypothetical protein